MAHIKIWIHCVWTTKNRFPLMTKDIRLQLFKHIRENALTKDIHIDHINGVDDHVHCLISMKAEQNIAKLVGLIKGESSHWVNQNKLTKSRFEWQDEYFAASISFSHVEAVREYIRDQEEHHKKVTWEEEYDQLLMKCGFERLKG